MDVAPWCYQWMGWMGLDGSLGAKNRDSVFVSKSAVAGLGMLLSSLSSLAPVIGFGVWKGMLLRFSQHCFFFFKIVERKNLQE